MVLVVLVLVVLVVLLCAGAGAGARFKHVAAVVLHWPENQVAADP